MTYIACEVCGSNHHYFLFEGWDRLFGIPGKFKIVQCKECGLIFINPQPGQVALKGFYPKDYYTPNSLHYREYTWLRKKVMETFWGYGHPSNSPKPVRLFKKVVLLPFRIRYRHSIPFVAGGRLLDIGCGNGTELYKLKRMGWEAYGVEMDIEASERARLNGLSVFTGNFFEANFPNNFFDVVRMSFVLEHLPNPKQTLIEVRRILRPYGRIYISVQNARSLNYWLFREKWFGLDVPRHLFSFTPKTIGMLLSTLGLEIKTIRYSSGTRTFLVSLRYWLNDRFQIEKRDRRNGAIFMKQFLKPLFRPFCWIIDRLKWGDLMHLEVIKT